MRPIDLLKNASDKKAVEVVFGIPLEEGEMQVMLKAVDILGIQETIDKKHSVLMKGYRDEGLDQMESDPDEWNKYLSDRKEVLKGQGMTVAQIRDALKEEVRPQSEAHRLANKYANIFAAREVIPTFLRCPQTGDFLFPSHEEKRGIAEIVKGNVDLMTLIAQKFGELNTKRAEVADKVKN